MQSNIKNKEKNIILLSGIVTNVTIFNSLGIKVEEQFVSSNHCTFNVSSYAKGLYSLEVNNRIVKFIK